MISVLILTKNELKDLPGCLESVGWSDDIIVLDSLSSDGTPELAARFGAKVVSRPFDNWASHQNWALRNIEFKHRWVLYVDADERVSPELAESILTAVSNPGSAIAFRIQRRDFLMGRWLKHVQASPYYVRLFQPPRMRYERLVNPISIADGPIGGLSGYLDHYPFSKGFGHWFERHNWYSGLEAQQILQNRMSHTQFSVWKALFARDFNERRFHQKELFYRLPARPVMRFLVLYILKRGFLDGWAGYTYARLQSIYESMIVLKTWELEQEASRTC